MDVCHDSPQSFIIHESTVGAFAPFLTHIEIKGFFGALQSACEDLGNFKPLSPGMTRTHVSAGLRQLGNMADNPWCGAQIGDATNCWCFCGAS